MKYTKELHEFLANNLNIDFSSIAIDGEVYTPSDIYSDLLGEISRLQAENARLSIRLDGECQWLEDEDGIYHTDCGEEYCYEASLSECESTIYCQHCGRKIVEIFPPAPEGEG